MNYNVTIGEKLTYPVCGKIFTATKDTMYIAAGGFVCEWKCFLKCGKKGKTDGDYGN